MLDVIGLIVDGDGLRGLGSSLPNASSRFIFAFIWFELVPNENEHVHPHRHARTCSGQSEQIPVVRAPAHRRARRIRAAFMSSASIHSPRGQRHHVGVHTRRGASESDHDRRRARRVSI
jgi:hypothetical protein